MKRVGIFGGSFNPIHRGHTGLANALVRHGLVDEVWLMPSPLNPLKRDQQSELLSHGERLRLARIATAPFPHLRVSDLEGRLPLPSYTYRTMTALTAEHGQDMEFVLIVGQDNWERFDRWRNYEDLLRQFDILAYGRAEAPAARAATVVRLMKHPDARETLIGDGFPAFDISGTRLRQALREGDIAFCKKWMNGHVVNYILRHKLYSAAISSKK